MGDSNTDLRAKADRLGLLLGNGAARRFTQLRGAGSDDEPWLAGLVMMAVREMYVVMATSEDPFGQMDLTLELEAQFDRPFLG
jgi:hypothetical protein